MTPRLLGILILVSMVAACGGGGGGNTPSGGSGPLPETLDTIYTGSKTQAQISEGNHAAIADSAWFGPLTAFELAQDVITEDVADGPVNETINGTGGGSARLSGRISGGTGTLTLEYSNFSEDGITLNGSETLTILTRRTMEAGSVRLAFNGLSMLEGGVTTTLYGSLTRTDSTPVGSRFIGSNWQITGDIVLKESGTGWLKRVSNLSLTRGYQQPGPFLYYSTLTGSARVFDSVHGYVDVAFESPVQFGPTTEGSDAGPGGSLVATGAGGSRLWVSPLSVTHVAVELADTGASQPTRSVVYRWDEAFDRPAGAGRTAPLTIAGPELTTNIARVGTPIAVDGRFSEAGGNGLLTQEWTLMLSPPGSQATLTNATSTRPTLLPDVEGSYQLRLRTSDGVNSSSDFLSVYANRADMEEPILGARMRFVLPPDQQAAVGTQVTIAGGRSYLTDNREVTNQRWRIEQRPFGSGSIVDQTGADAVFSVEAEQDYYATFTGVENYSGHIPMLNGIWVSAPGNVRFATPLALHRQSEYLMTAAVNAIDVDGNARPDLVEERYSDLTGETTYSMLLNRGAGRFDRFSQTFSGGASVFGGMAAQFVDIDGDQRVDIVMPDRSGVRVSYQTRGGSFGFDAPVVLPGSTVCGVEPAALPDTIVVLDVDRDGRKDIVSSTPCDPFPQLPLQIYINDPAEPGGFRAPVSLPITVPFRRFIAGDVDGDGHEDLIGLDLSSSPGRVMVWRNEAGGTFQLLQALNVQATQVSSRRPLTFGDVNADGRADILISSNAGAEVILVGAGGALTLRPPLVWRGGFDSEHVMIVDLNRDGRPDLALPSGWWRQLATGDFAPLRTYTAEIKPNDIADLNGDGLLDLVGTPGPLLALGAE